MSHTSFSLDDLQAMERIPRLNLINSISGYKSANLIGTISDSGYTNLALFSSVVHLGSDPAMLAFIMRPTKVERHTYNNIIAQKYYTINHVPADLTAEAHYTSAKFDKFQSEFQHCGFTELYHDTFIAPYVAASAVQIGMEFLQELHIEANGTIMMIGIVKQLHIATDIIQEDHALNLDQAGVAAISGLNSYYRATKVAKYPYARVGQFPKTL